MKDLHALDWIALLLVIIGALNWGLIGVFDFNLVAELFGHESVLSRVIYTLVGLSGLYLIFLAMQLKKKPVGTTATSQPAKT